MIRVWIRPHPFAKRSKMVCSIITRRLLGQSPHDGNSCLGAIWSLLLGFFGQSLYLDMFSSSIYDFLPLFWIIQTFLRTIILNNYLVDKSLKINFDKVQIIHNFIIIQSSILFSCMHPHFKHLLSTNHKII